MFVPEYEFQSAFIAVVRLTVSAYPLEGHVKVSIRFHRGGPSHRNPGHERGPTN